MTREVLAYGDDDRPPPSGPGRAVGALVAIVLVVLAGVAVTRSRDAARAAREGGPTASPTTPFGVPTATDDAAPPEPPDQPDPFARFVTVRRPPPGVVRSVLLHDGRPAFLLPVGDEALPLAIAAIGGSDHAPVLVGWCARTRQFHDVGATTFYDEYGYGIGPDPALPVHAVRFNPGDRTRIDVGGAPTARAAGRPGDFGQPCPHRLHLPGLPRRAAAVHETIPGFRVVRGQYVVTTTTRAFCKLSVRDCAADGWEVYAVTALPPGDLVGSYRYEGDFLVRGGTDGSLTVARLPAARLVARDRVGASVRVGLGRGVHQLAGRNAAGAAYRLEFNPFRHVSGEPDDVGEPGATEPWPRWRHLMNDISPDPVEWVIRTDAEVVLGPGITGPGRARGTARTLQRYLTARSGREQALWVVLDDRDRVLRVVIEPPAEAGRRQESRP